MQDANKGGRKGMPVRFSDSYLKTLKVPKGKREFVQFERGTGLGVRVQPSGKISFILQVRLTDGRKWHETLKPWGAITVEQARAIAQARNADAARGGEDGDLFKRRAAEIAAAKAAKEAAEAASFTVRKLVRLWERDHLKDKRPSYAVRAVRTIETKFAELLDTSAAAVTRQEVAHAVNRTREASGASTARFAAAVLRAAMHWATKRYLLDAHPLRDFALPPLTKARERVLSADEVRRIYAAAGELPFPAGPFVRLLLLSGCRRSEIAQLRWDEIEIDDEGCRTIALPGERTKSGTGHRVHVSTAAAIVIDGCPRVVGCPFVFSADGRRAFSDFGRIKNRLDAEIAREAAPLPHWTYHDFRRSLVSLLAKAGFDTVALDRLIGHVPVKLTGVARVYQHFDYWDTRVRALEKWGELVTQVPAKVVEITAQA